MGFVLTEQQQLVRETAAQFVRERMPVSHFRKLRDERDPLGFSRAIWKEMAQLGLAGTIVPEVYGGAGLGHAELGLILEECGRHLAPTPLLSTVALGVNALLLAATEAQRAEILPGVCRGETLLAWAHDEGVRHSRYSIATRAQEVQGGFVLSGAKSFVVDGHAADWLIVTARSSGDRDGADGLSLFLVPATARGVERTRLSTVDQRGVARVLFQQVSVETSSLLGTIGEASPLVDQILDRGAIALSAEMLGSTQEAFDRTIEYLKVRKQFGVPIGSFQALKHRAALMYCEVELSRSIAREALTAIDDKREDVDALACAAKARLTDTYLLVANEAIQMHGGIGVTDELDIGFFLKRARVCEMIFGDSAWHRDRYARLHGY